MYWLFGPAGSGKSTIAYTVARRFEFAGDADDTKSYGTINLFLTSCLTGIGQRNFGATKLSTIDV